MNDSGLKPDDIKLIKLMQDGKRIDLVKGTMIFLACIFAFAGAISILTGHVFGFSSLLVCLMILSVSMIFVAVGYAQSIQRLLVVLSTVVDFKETNVDEQ